MMVSNNLKTQNKIDLVKLIKDCKHIKYTDNPIIQYYLQIENENNKQKIPACKKLIKQYRKLARDVVNPGRKTYTKDSEGNDVVYSWVYDNNLARHAIFFKENYCCHSKGKLKGKPIKLELWQKAMYSALYGFKDEYTGLRKYKVLFLDIARKNGKTTLAASDGLYAMIGDNEGGAEVYSVATNSKQSKIVWLAAKSMIKKSPIIKRRLKGLVAEIAGLDISKGEDDGEDYSDALFRFLGRDSDSLDGLNTHCGIFDELHAWRDFNLWDEIVDSMAAREQPLLIITTTAGTVRESVYDVRYDYYSKVIDDIEGFEDERVLPIIYELDSREDLHNPKLWKKANPGLGTIKNEMELMEKFKRALAVPSQMSNLLTKDFNVPQTVTEAWLSLEDILNEESFDIKEIENSYCIGGVDLAATTDLTCATLLIMKPDSDKKYVLQMYWLPSTLIDRRVYEDKIPYDKWVEQGYVRLSGLSSNDHRDVTAWFLEMMEKYKLFPWKIGYDRALASSWMQDMREHNFNDYEEGRDGVLDKVAQGKFTFTQPMRYMEADFKDKKIIYNNNPVLKWCLTNTVTETDKNENIRPIKGRNKRQRIDGTMSLLDAYVELHKFYNDYSNII